MKCSKIFSGDLPELTYKILKYFHNDYKTLYSCILVNRLWCRLAIPLLWEDPFSKKFPKNCNFVEIFLHFLNDDDKTKLNEHEINYNLISSKNVLFNYPTFIKSLSTKTIVFSIDKWISTVITSTTEIEPDDDSEEIHQVFLQFNCKSISSFYFHCPAYYDNDNVLTDKYLSQLINSQQNLQKILFGYYNNLPLYHSLLSLKSSNCSNTLTTIIFYCVDFKNVNILNEVFEQLNVLESIHLLCCNSLNDKFVQQIVNITKPFKLKTLILINEISNNEPLELLLQKSGDYLENFGSFVRSCASKLLELILKYCKNVKFLDLNIALSDNKNVNIFPMLNVIENIQQNLNYLSINTFNHQWNDIEIGSTILLNLGQILPFKLEYLNLKLFVNSGDFKVFLKNSENTFIKKLLICNMKYQTDDILFLIKEYIMKKKRVEYLAVENNFSYNPIIGCKDLSSLKDEVKEFKLYDIQVFRYDNLCIDVRNFIKEID
ncbi:hypothetical protein C1645_832077 [Glomus cerebriforme]|uniref:F-box domain-containing protein n=1 Tax=Glomus cerebriforme TaxID=658196 RepID=A0A397SP12_9GLOM|nr:hypothetical protein C1645_832077 [Glomus cerebriforme]